MSKSFKVAFVGTGWVGDHQMKHLSKLDGVECVAAADLSDAPLQRFKTAWNPTHTFTDYRQMLAEVKELDAISVCTPNGLHAQNTIDALQAGHHVLVEKPMAMNAREGQRMLDAARAAGKQLIVGFQHRFEPKTKLIRDQIASGSFGKIHYVRAQALRRRGIPNWGVFGRKELQGGGPMIDIGVHILESAHYMIGSPRPVSASSASHGPDAARSRHLVLATPASPGP